MKKIKTYGDTFTPVPFSIDCLPEDQLRLPSGSGNPTYVACTNDGYLGCAELVFQAAEESGHPCAALGWVFPVMGTVFTKRLWWEWAMLDGTLSRNLHCERRPATFDEACSELLASYQSPTTFGLTVRKEQGHLVKLR